MNSEDALQIVETIIPPGSLNQVKILVFRDAWEGKGYAEIAETAGYDIDYIKGVASQLWKSLSPPLGAKVTKKNFRSLLIQRFSDNTLVVKAAKPIHNNQELAFKGDVNVNGTGDVHTSYEQTSASPSPASPKVSFQLSSLSHHDWSTAPDVSTFFGRTDERQQIRRWIESDDSRLIAVLGMGGMGKTSLVTKVAQDLQEDRDYIFWRSLRNAPPLDIWLRDVVAFLTDQTVLDGSIDTLLTQLQAHRCLLILDNTETILQPGVTGFYRSGYEDYGQLFQTIGETAHQSCLLLTSREKPPEIAALEGMELGVKSYPLQGDLDVAIALIQKKGLVGTTAEQRQLSEQFGCSPLALKIVATSIQDLFEGQIADFLADGTLTFNGIRRLLTQHWQRLSSLEQGILYWLAINRTWTSIPELAQDLLSPISRGQLLEALESLRWRSLVERHRNRYSLQPVVLDYVTDQLIEGVFQNIRGNTTETHGGEQSPSLLCHYALIKTTSQDYIRATQTRFILTPIADRVRKVFPTPALMHHCLQTALHQLRSHQSQRANDTHGEHYCPDSGYGAGNLLNLSINLGLELTNLDFTQLAVRHGYLRKADLHGVNFAQAHFVDTVFKHTFGSILALTYSPNGDFFAGAGTTGHIRIWRTSDGQLHQLLPSHAAWIYGLAYSPDGNVIASAPEAPYVKLWDVNTGHCLQTLDLSEFCHATNAVAFSADGRTLAIGTNRASILLYNLDTQKMRSLTGHRQGVQTVAFSPDQQFLASGGRDHTVRLWDITTEECVYEWSLHQSLVRTLAFSPDSTWLVSGGEDRRMYRWHVQTGECLTVYEGHQRAVYSLCLSADGQTLISGSEDQTIRCWHVTQGHCIKSLQGHEGGIWATALSPDDRILVSSSTDRQVRVWNLTSGNSLRTLRGYTDYTYGLTFSPDGQTLTTASSNGLVRLWDWSTKTCRQTFHGHHNWVWDTTWSPDGQTLASGSLDHDIRLWHPTNGSCLKILKGHENSVMQVTWHPQGHLLASGGHDNVIRLWEPDTGQCRRIMQVPQGWVQSLAWSPSGHRLASGSSDHLVRLWDGKSGDIVHCLSGHQGWVNQVTWMPDGAYLVSGSHDCMIKIWDSTDGKCLKTLTESTAPVFTLAVSPDGRLLASGDFNATIHLWDTATWACIQTLTGHNSLISDLTFHPTQPILVSGSEDETIRCWDINSGECLKILQATRPYEGMNIAGASGLTPAQRDTLEKLGASLSGAGVTPEH